MILSKSFIQLIVDAMNVGDALGDAFLSLLTGKFMISIL